ncbi:gyg-1 [Symbiodinium natans]|uniref:Gyg-1 protein n=1 Tax=Symbiodinium natans TaxID=878477 RepID=A0A812NZ61_9DINO|nr:gyg-1 [Symbiodinium natans]
MMAVQALAASLKAAKAQPMPLLVLHTDQVSAGVQSRLAADPSLQLRCVDVIPNPHVTDVSGWVNSGFTKLRLWEQVDFEKIVYIDADCLVLENIDELFQRECPAFCPDVFPPDKFNAGVIVLEPSRDVFEEMKDKIAVLPSHDGGDTGFLNAFFPDWYRWPHEQRLPFQYNALRTMYWFTRANPGYWESIQPVKVLHFCSSPKPWDKEAKKGDLEVLWWEHYLKSQVPF